jgi:protein phosphatase
MTQLTADHSEAAELLRLRLITPEQARDHPRRSMLTRALGGNLLMRPDFSRHVLQPDDRLVICTDGLWGEVELDAIHEAAQLEPPRAAERMIELACENGGGDNVSVHVIRVVELGAAAPAPTGRIGRLLAGLRGG